MCEYDEKLCKERCKVDSLCDIIPLIEGISTHS